MLELPVYYTTNLLIGQLNLTLYNDTISLENKNEGLGTFASHVYHVIHYSNNLIVGMDFCRPKRRKRGKLIQRKHPNRYQDKER